MCKNLSGRDFGAWVAVLPPVSSCLRAPRAEVGTHHLQLQHAGAAVSRTVPPPPPRVPSHPPHTHTTSFPWLAPRGAAAGTLKRQLADAAAVDHSDLQRRLKDVTDMLYLKQTQVQQL